MGERCMICKTYCTDDELVYIPVGTVWLKERELGKVFTELCHPCAGYHSDKDFHVKPTDAEGKEGDE